VTTNGNEALWQITAAIDRWKPLYFVRCSRSFVILLRSYRRARSLTTRKQMQWSCGAPVRRAAVLPLLRDSFVLGAVSRARVELAGFVPWP